MEKRWPEDATHRFAADGFSFAIPEQWNLSVFDLGRRVSRIEMEDDYAKRLELEWLRLPSRVRLDTVHQRYAKASRQLAQAARETAALKDAPQGWTAFLYRLPEERRLLTLYHLAVTRFYFFSLHFDATDKEDPAALLRLITSSFRSHARGLIPWECYDLAIQLNSDFKLAEKTFVAGRKALVFTWRLRRLYVWLFSLADLALKGRPAAEWAADYLHTLKGLRAVRFVARKDGALVAQRPRFRLAHADELSRLCFRYRLGVRHLPERNQIFLWVYHYRRARDLEKLAGFDIENAGE